MVPHNDFGGLNFKGLTSKDLLLMTLPPADDEKMKKNRTSGTPTSKKTSDSASLSKVCHTKVKLKISETNFCESYGPACDWRCMPDPPIYSDRVRLNFCSFWGRMSPKLHVGFLVRHDPVGDARAPNMVVCAK